jgi:hypothetical protein
MADRLRNHPKLKMGVFNSWPPMWTSAGSNASTGETGTLKHVELRTDPGSGRRYLVLAVEDSGEDLRGVLVSVDRKFLERLAEHLSTRQGRTISDLGAELVDF